MDAGRNGSTSNGRIALTIGVTARTPNPAAMTAGCPGRNDPAARPTAAKNAVTATIPITSPTTIVEEGAPYRTTIVATVTAIGTSTAETASIAVDVSHLDVQIAVRETGLDATQDSVPVWRSTTIRLPTAKIAASTQICAPTALSRLSSGTREPVAGASAPSGR